MAAKRVRPKKTTPKETPPDYVRVTYEVYLKKGDSLPADAQVEELFASAFCIDKEEQDLRWIELPAGVRARSPDPALRILR